jgi:hypothetical protein
MSIFVCFRPVFYIAIVLTLAGCVSSDTKWRHNSIAPDGWSVDAAQCKWEARQTAEKQYDQDLSLTGQSGYQNAQSVDAMFARSEIDKHARTLFNDCMTSLGYVEAD